MAENPHFFKKYFSSIMAIVMVAGCVVAATFFSIHSPVANAAGTNWYVRPDGGTYGSANGTSWSDAWSGFSKISSVACGDTIWVAGGTYTSSLNISKNCTASDPLTINKVLSTDAVPTAASGWNSSFDSQVVLPNISVPGPAAYITINGRQSSPSYGIQVLIKGGGDGIDASNNGNNGPAIDHITWSYVEVYGPACVESESCSDGVIGVNVMPYCSTANRTNLLFDHMSIHRTGEAFRGCGWDTSTIQYTSIYDTHNDGQQHEDILYSNPPYQNVTWRYNKIFMSPNDGIFFEGGTGAVNWAFYGNTVYHSGGSLISFKTGSKYGPVHIYNNVFENDGTFGDYQPGWLDFTGTMVTGSEVANNIFENIDINGTAPNASHNAYSASIGKGDSGVGTFTYTPASQFVNENSSNPIAADFHLTTTGATAFANKGETLSAPYNMDMDGNVRGADGTYDIGAYEYSGSSGGGGTPPPPPPPPSDTTPPTVSITSPASGATISGTVSLTASASDNVGVSTVSFRVDGSSVGSDATSPYTFSWNTSSVSNGTHVLSATALDAAGNAGTSASISVTVANSTSGSGGGTTSTTVLALDPSTPPAMKGAGAHTTASFTPPAGSVIVVAALSDETSLAQTFAVTDNRSSHLTYHPIAASPYGNTGNDARVEAWWASVPTSQAMTITVTPADTGRENMLRVLVFTGANATDPIGAAGGGRTSTNLSLSYAASASNSWGWLLYNDWSQKGVPSIPANESIDSTYNPSGFITAAVMDANTFPASAGSSVILSTLTPASGLQVSYMYFEVVPASSSGGGTTPPPPPPSDTTPPSTPANLSASAISTSQINLAWSASTDNVGVTGYKIYRNGTQVATTASTNYANTGLAASTAYTYAVSAYDAAGNTSAQSNGASATTQTAVDTTPPTVSITSPASGATISGTVSLTASASDNVGMVKVEFFADGSLINTDLSIPYAFSLNTTSLTNGSHAFSAKAYDTAGNVGTSVSVPVTVANVITDTTPPSVPARLAAGNITTSTISLAWNPSTDNISVAGYRIMRNGVLISTTTLPAFTDTKLVANTNYVYAVSAYDAAGNVSALSGNVGATTQAIPVTPPLIASITVDQVTDTTARVVALMNAPASIQVKYGPTTSYGATTQDSPVLTTIYVNLTGLSQNTVYDFAILATGQGSSTPTTSGNYTFITASTPSSGGNGGGGTSGGGSGSGSGGGTSSGGGGTSAGGSSGGNSGGGGASFPPPVVQPTSTPPAIISVTFPRNISFGDTGTDVHALQLLLQNLGFLTNTIAPTEYFGTLTEHALLLFQNVHQLNKSGFVDLQTQTLLNKVAAGNPAITGETNTTSSAPSTNTGSFPRNLGQGSQGVDVSALQHLLFADGDYPQNLITGYYGTLTMQAVQRFQAKYGIVNYGTPATTGYGAVGPKTRAKLSE